MAFTSTIQQKGIPPGNYRIAFGTFDGGGENGGDVSTGLNRVLWFIPYPSGSSGPAAQIAVNETFPLAGGTVTIACGADVDGYWVAGGY